MNCIRLLGYSSIRDFEKLTIPEYELLMEGAAYRKVDMEYWANRVAWLTMVAKSKKKSGKKLVVVYKKFRNLFNIDAAVRELEGKIDSRNGKGKTL